MASRPSTCASAAERSVLAHRLPGPCAELERIQQAALAPGALRGRDKELVALGAAIALRDCALVEEALTGALQAGLSADEIVDGLGTCLLTLGPPAASTVIRALRTLYTLSAEERLTWGRMNSEHRPARRKPKSMAPVQAEAARS